MKHKYQLLIGVFFLCLYSCKKETQAAGTGTLIVGKWYFMKQVSVLYQSTKEISTFTKTNFTNDDFIEYYNDGSGYYSKSTAQGPSLSEFTYKISGATITQYTSTENPGIAETIKTITSTGLAVHVVQLVQDPNDPTVTDTEVDDFTYTR
jgi:hypothetical protein